VANLDDIRNRFQRIVAAPRDTPARPSVQSSSARLFSAYVNEDVDEASAIAARLSEITSQHGGGAEGLDAALSEAERLLATEAVQGLVQYALKLFVTRDPTAKRFLRLGRLEQRQPNAVRGARPNRGDEDDKEE
jgi:hypothetical protein